MWGIIPSPERIPDAIILIAIGMIIAYGFARFIYWMACRELP